MYFIIYFNLIFYENKFSPVKSFAVFILVQYVTNFNNELASLHRLIRNKTI